MDLSEITVLGSREIEEDAFSLSHTLNRLPLNDNPETRVYLRFGGMKIFESAGDTLCRTGVEMPDNRSIGRVKEGHA
jgi:hypothetical protein